MKSAPSCSATSPSCAPPSCSRRTASTAPSNISRAPSITAIRSTPQEVIQKWGREDIVGDYVRLLRTLRPDVVLTMNIQGRGGDRAHEATTVLFREAYYAAGDPSKYPEQLREGLRPWQPKKLYFAAAPAPADAGRPRRTRAPQRLVHGSAAPRL